MAITLQCPNLLCRTVLQVRDSLRGRKVRCAQCGTAFVVPKQKGGTAPTPVSPAMPVDADQGGKSE